MLGWQARPGQLWLCPWARYFTPIAPVCVQCVLNKRSQYVICQLRWIGLKKVYNSITDSTKCTILSPSFINIKVHIMFSEYNNLIVILTKCVCHLYSVANCSLHLNVLISTFKNLQIENTWMNPIKPSNGMMPLALGYGAFCIINAVVSGSKLMENDFPILSW